MSFKGFGGLGKIIGAFLLCVFVAQFAMAVEGMGAHRGSFVFFPYWTKVNPFLTVWRISNATDLNDPTLLPRVRRENDPNYDSNPVQLHIFFMETPTCEETDSYFPFSPNDYRLIVVNNIRSIANSGWAYGYATLVRADQPVQVLLWDRFFSDSVVVNTADGWARGWHNWQQWGRKDVIPGVGDIVVDNAPAGVCNYTRDTTADYNPAAPGLAPANNDVCVYGPDNVGFNVSVMSWLPTFFVPASGYYWPTVAPTNFFSNYFTDDFRFSGVRAQDTEFSITAIETLGFDELLFGAVPGVGGFFGESIVFSSDLVPDYDFDAIGYDEDEQAISVPTGRVVCQAVLGIHDLTSNRLAGIPQGYVNFWALDPQGEFLPPAPDWDAAAVLSWERFPSGRSELAWAYWTTHDKTSVDDRDLHTVLTEDWNPEAP